VRARVVAARDRQRVRYGHTGLPLVDAAGRRVVSTSAGHGGITNASAPIRLIAPAARLDTDARTMLVRAADRLMLSARGYHRVLRVARTIADLDACDAVLREHVGEALRYRPASQEPVATTFS